MYRLYGAVKFLICATIVLCSVSSTNSKFVPSEICSNIANGTFIKDPSSCSIWIHCVDNQVIVGQCENGLFFDKDAKKCASAEQIKCSSSNPCAVAQNAIGFFPDPYSCNGYYYCKNGQGALGRCSAGMNFNHEALDCQSTYECKLPSDPESLCNIVPEGVFIKDRNENSCSKFYICWEGKLHHGTCPEGFHFNSIKGVCGYMQNVNCSCDEPPILSNGVCQFHGQFVSDNKTCSGYYLCRQNTFDESFFLLWGKCPLGRFFNPKKGGSCIDRTQIACKYDRCDGTTTDTIQLVNLTNDGCEGFGICQNGLQISTGKCANGSYYDEVQHNCVTSEVSYPACLFVDT